MGIFSEAVLTGWYVGYVIAAVTITAVVVLVGIILGLARRIGHQAAAVEASLEQSRINTLPMWDVAVVNDLLADTVAHAATARTMLEDM